MLYEDYTLISEGIIEKIDHVTGSGLKADVPEKELVFPDILCALFRIFGSLIFSHCRSPPPLLQPVH